MKIWITFICIAFSSSLTFAQTLVNPIQIDFETYFKGKPDKLSPFVALTALTWRYNYNARIGRSGVHIEFNNQLILEKNRSWVKLERLQETEQRARVLHHEQGHVNICFIMVKEADKVLSNQTYSKRNYQSQIGTLAASISDFFDTMQRNYDEETEHGSNYKMQARWDKIIQDKMDEVTGR